MACLMADAELLASIASRNGAPAHGHTAGTDASQVRKAATLADRPPDRESSARPSSRGGRRIAAGPVRRWTPPTAAPRRLMTLPETAAYLGLTPWSVRELQWKGRLPRVNLGRKLLFDRADVDRLIDAAKEHP